MSSCITDMDRDKQITIFTKENLKVYSKFLLRYNQQKSDDVKDIYMKKFIDDEFITDNINQKLSISDCNIDKLIENSENLEKTIDIYLKKKSQYQKIKKKLDELMK